MSVALLVLQGGEKKREREGDWAKGGKVLDRMGNAAWESAGNGAKGRNVLLLEKIHALNRPAR